MSFEPLRRSRRWTVLAAVFFLVAGLLGSGAATAQAAGGPLRDVATVSGNLGSIAGNVGNQANVGVAGIQVNAYRASGVSATWQIVASTTTGSTSQTAGHFSLTVPAGTYRLGFVDPRSVYSDAYSYASPTLEGATDIVVAAGARTVADGKLFSGGFSGLLTNTDGVPLYRCAVEAVSENADLPIGSNQVDEYGRFSVYGLTTGDYKVVVNRAGDCGDKAAYYRSGNTLMTTDETQATTIHIVSNETFHLASRDLQFEAPHVVKNFSSLAFESTPAVGTRAFASGSAWAPSGVHLAYQWSIDGQEIPGATGSEYIPVVEDIGKHLQVRVSAVYPGYESATELSPVSDAVEEANVWTTSRSTLVDSDGNGSIEISCIKSCSGTAQVWSDAAGTLKSEFVPFAVAAGTKSSLSFADLPYITTTGARLRIVKSNPYESPNPQFNELELTKKIPANVWATTRAAVVDNAGNGTVNVSCTKACSGWAQVWSDPAGTKKSEAKKFTLKAGTWMPLKFTSLPYVTSTTAKVRIYKTTPHEAPNPQFNNLTLTKK